MRTTGTVPIEFESLGDPSHPAMVLIMGLGMQLVAWPDVFCQALVAGGYRVVRFDNRDSGLSGRGTGGGGFGLFKALAASVLKLPVPSPYTLHDMAQDTLAVMDALQIKQAHIVGISMGGMIGQVLAATHPQRVLSLTSIMSTSGHRRLQQPSLKVRRVLMSRPAKPQDVASVTDHLVHVLQVIGSPGYREPEQALRERVAKAVTRAYNPAGTNRQVMAVIASGDRRPLLRQIRTPTLVIHGRDDPLVPLSGGQDTAEQVPGAKLLVIDGMGHDLSPALLPQLAQAILAHCKAVAATSPCPDGAKCYFFEAPKVFPQPTTPGTTLMTPSLDTLNTGFALPAALQFAELAPGLPVAEISTPLASARIALQGAQVLSWQPAGQQPVLWVSKAAVFEPGKGVRGGVPVCWPWFGVVPGQVAHGLVRTRLWQVRGTELDAAGQVVLRLGMSDDASTRAIWNHAFDLELVVTVGTTLTMALITRNTGSAPMSITQALHSYFCTGDITQTAVQGLDGGSYLDKVQDFAACQQNGDVRFAGETDRIYTDTTADSLIHDGAGGRTIRIAKQGSASTVVWNPWTDKEKTIADMAAGDYRQMLCVETCNAGPDGVTLPAGGTHALVATISVA